MKKLSFFVIVLVVLVQLIIAAPVAAGPKVPVGGQISIFDVSIEFPANTTFHIQHGWGQGSKDGAIGIFDFTLEVDGILQKEDYKLFYLESGDPDLLYRYWVFNYPDGMTGVHTFTGHWYAPCQYAVDGLGYPGPCPAPNSKVEIISRTLTVTFVP